MTKSPTGKITAAPGYTILNARQVNARSPDLETFAVPTPDGGGIKAVGLSEAFDGKPSVSYDPATDTHHRQRPPATTYVARNATLGQCRRQRLQPARQGWKENVGLQNFTNALTDPTLRAGFFKILVWNIFFSCSRCWRRSCSASCSPCCSTTTGSS